MLGRWIWDRTLMVRGKIDQSGKAIHAFYDYIPYFADEEPKGLNKKLGIRINLDKKQFEISDLILNMKEISLPNNKIQCSMYTKWRGFGGMEFINTEGRLFEMEDSVVFAGNYRFYGKDDSSEYSNSKKIDEDENFRYVAVKKDTILGFTTFKKGLELYCLVMKKKVRIKLDLNTEEFNINEFPFLHTVFKIENLKKFDKQH